MDIIGAENFHQSKLLVEQHFHGCFGIDFSVCEADEVITLAKKLLRHGIGGFYPTLVTDNVDNIKRQIARIKEAREKQKSEPAEMADILGIHLEGIFINSTKKGIHDENLFLDATVENYKLIEDDFIKIVTLAPELDVDGKLRKYLKLKGVKAQAGHCISGDLTDCTGVTHTFNAMSGINHRDKSTALSALIEDELYTEIIADGIHLSDDILKLIFKAKPENKVILVSDSLPIAQSNLKELDFAGQKVFYDGQKATSKEGTLAGSTAVLNKIVQRLSLNNPDKFKEYVKMASDNLFEYHEIKLNGGVFWDENFEIVAIEKDGSVLYKNS